MSSSSSPIELSWPLDREIHTPRIRLGIAFRPSEGLFVCLYVHHAASYGVRKKSILSPFALIFNLVKVQE